MHHKICGQLVVISDPSDKAKLESLMENGIKNGVEGLKFLTNEEISKQEPHIESAGAL